MIHIVTDSKRVFEKMARVASDLKYVDIVEPTHNEETGRRTAIYGTLEEQKTFEARKEKAGIKK